MRSIPTIEQFFEPFSVNGKHLHTKLRVILRDGTKALVYKVLPATIEYDEEYRPVKILQGSHQNELYLNGQYYVNYLTSSDIVSILDENGNLIAGEILIDLF
jgi:hypothetical protein